VRRREREKREWIGKRGGKERDWPPTIYGLKVALIVDESLSTAEGGRGECSRG